MRRIVKVLSLLSFIFLGTQVAKAQLYDVAIGGQVDTGVGESLVGVSIKYQPF